MKAEDIITHKSYIGLVDHIYDAPDFILPNASHKVVHCHIDNIRRFFEEIARTDLRIILVSSDSDFGVCDQKQHHPAWDMVKYANMLIDANLDKIGYQGINLPPRVNFEQCNPNDTYSAKCYMYTNSTFNVIPKNIIRWYCTNCSITSNRIVGIPFGCQKNTQDKLAGRLKSPKSKLYYINWQNYTFERSQIKKYYRNNPRFTIIEEPKPIDEYLREMSQFMFVLCPSSNGADSYRLIECLALGCIPIVEDNVCMRHLEGLPIIYVKDFKDVESVTYSEDGIYRFRYLELDDECLNKAKLSWWKDQIQKDKERYL